MKKSGSKQGKTRPASSGSLNAKRSGRISSKRTLTAATPLPCWPDLSKGIGESKTIAGRLIKKPVRDFLEEDRKTLARFAITRLSGMAAGDCADRIVIKYVEILERDLRLCRRIILLMDHLVDAVEQAFEETQREAVDNGSRKAKGKKSRDRTGAVSELRRSDRRTSRFQTRHSRPGRHPGIV